MTTLPEFNKVSVIVPTIGRPESLRRMFDSLCQQTVRVHEVIVADGSNNEETMALVAEYGWERQGMTIKRVSVHPPNAVRQRIAAINQAAGEFLLLLDDDVVLEPECVECMVRLLTSEGDVVGVFGDFNNQTWAMPTFAWRLYLRHVLRMEDGAWQGRVVGPLLRFGYNPPPRQPMPMEWLGTCNTMIRRSAYDRAGGFSQFFLHRCTMNEDLDLGLKLSRVGRILFCPTARMGHFHAPGGRVSPMVAAEDDLYNRYLIMCSTQGRSAAAAGGLVLLFFVIETLSNVGGSLLRLKSNGFFSRAYGRSRALLKILFGITAK